MEQLTACPTCGNSRLNNYLTCQDFLVSQQEFTIQECQACGLLLTNPRPDEKQIGTYYQSDQYISHDDTQSGLLASVYRLVRSYSLKQKVKLLRKANPIGKKVFDMGCGTGAFLKVCQQAGWEINGLEPDEDARNVAEQHLHTPLLKKLTNIPIGETFDVITLWHVLEHITNLTDTLRQFHQLLNLGGTLIIAVPNPESWDAQHYKSLWAAYDLPRHLYHFRPRTLQAMIEKIGFTLTVKKPLPFDSFYISMLSTAHRDGKTAYIESLVSGLTSNKKAAQTGHYSSLIYVFNRI